MGARAEIGKEMFQFWSWHFCLLPWASALFLVNRYSYGDLPLSKVFMRKDRRNKEKNSPQSSMWYTNVTVLAISLNFLIFVFQFLNAISQSSSEWHLAWNPPPSGPWVMRLQACISKPLNSFYFLLNSGSCFRNYNTLITIIYLSYTHITVFILYMSEREKKIMATLIIGLGFIFLNCSYCIFGDVKWTTHN